MHDEVRHATLHAYLEGSSAQFVFLRDAFAMVTSLRQERHKVRRKHTLIAKVNIFLFFCIAIVGGVCAYKCVRLFQIGCILVLFRDTHRVPDSTRID